MPDIDSPENVKIVVDTFYKKASSDELLGPIFYRIENLPKKQALYVYWQKELLNRSISQPDGLPDHIFLMSSPQHFVRWSELFLEILEVNFSGPMTDKAKVTVLRKSNEFQKSLAMFRF